MKRIVLILMVLGIMVSSLHSQVFSLEGSGTESDPYLVQDLQDLITISENSTIWDKHFLQTADIDASATSDLNDGAGFSPIGSSTSWNNQNLFTGTYDGNCNSISNLFINRPSTSYIGLFGYTESADISNLGLLDSEIIGGGTVGGLVGYYSCSSTATIDNSDYLSSSRITNCYVTGSISGDNVVGGLVGKYNVSTDSPWYSGNYSIYFVSTASSNIINCFTEVTVLGNSDIVGGLIGLYNISSSSDYYDLSDNSMTSSTSNSYIEDCYTTGTVNGVNYVGGLIGYYRSSCFSHKSTSSSSAYSDCNSHIKNCFAKCSVDGLNYVGGLVGSCDNFATCSVTSALYNSSNPTSNCEISSCYTTCFVNGIDFVGGMVGSLSSYSTAPLRCSSRSYSSITNCYTKGSTFGNSNIGGLSGALYASSTNSSNRYPHQLYVRPYSYALINKSYAACSVTGSNDVGGLVGNSSSSVSYCNDSYATDDANRSIWDIETSGQISSEGGIGKSTANMKKINTYLSLEWDFVNESNNGTEDIWDIDSSFNSGYPYLSQNFEQLFDPNDGDDDDHTLPVELSSFSAIATSDNFAQISWVTASESNLIGYNIYRSDTENLEDALRVTATMITASNQAISSSYSFTDDEVEMNTTYNYWLLSNDFDGTSQTFGPITVEISDQENNDIDDILLGTKLYDNYPNPFNPETTISYSISQPQYVRLEVYNMRGQLVKTLLNEKVETANRKLHVVWNGKNSNNNRVSSGIYLYRLVTDDYIKNKALSQQMVDFDEK